MPSPPDQAKPNSLAQNVADEKRSFWFRFDSYLRKNSDPILSFSAMLAVMISVLGLCITAKYNLRSSELQAEIATQQASADSTQAALGARSLDYEAAGVSAAQTSVALQDEQAQIRSTLSPTEPSSEATRSPKEATATAQAVLQAQSMFEAESAIYEYFQLLNQDLYGEAWSRLTPRFQQVFSSGSFANYQAFWQTVDKVAVVEAVALSVNSEANSAIVLVRLRFFQSGYDWDRSYEYKLLRDPVTRFWKIDSTTLISG